MLVATPTDHAGKGLWIFNGGAEYALMVAAVALAVAVVVAVVGGSGVLLVRDRRMSTTGPADASGSAHMTDGAAM